MNANDTALQTASGDLQASVCLLVSGSDLGLSIVMNSGWDHDSDRPAALAKRSAESDKNTHIQILRFVKDESDTVISHSVEAVKGNPGATVWRVSLKEGDDHFTTHWDCLAVDADEAAELAEAANPGMTSTHECQMDIVDYIGS